MGSHTIQQQDEHPARQVMDSLRRLVQVLRVASRDAERTFGISAAQLFVLLRLRQAGKPLSVNELAERTLTHQSSVSVVVKKLVDAGLVARVSASDDRRRLQLTLTPSARHLLRKAPEAAQERLLDSLQQMDRRRCAQLAELLGEVVRALGLEDQPPQMLFDTEAKRKTGKERRRNAGA